MDHDDSCDSGFYELRSASSIWREMGAERDADEPPEEID
jgi:hypothetical protein